MTLKNLRPLVVALGTLAIVAACGGGGGGGTTAKETLTIGGFNFSESSILADMYGQALKAKGYTIAYKLNLGSREVVAPALKTGQVDLYPGYAATELEFFNNKKGEAGGDPQANVTKLNTYLSAFGAEALTPSPASDENAFAVTKALATKDNLVKISDLKPVASQLVLGGPPECPTRPYCELGLKSVYGLTFKDFKSLAAGSGTSIDCGVPARWRSSGAAGTASFASIPSHRFRRTNGRPSAGSATSRQILPTGCAAGWNPPTAANLLSTPAATTASSATGGPASSAFRCRAGTAA